METITLQFNPKSSFAQALLNLIKVSGEVTVVETKATAKKPRTINKDDENAEIVAKVRRGREEFRKGKCTTIKADEIWN